MLNPIIKFKLETKCSICGVKTGELELSSEFGWIEGKVTLADVGIIDSRCSADELAHGSFKEMVEEYRQKVKDDWAEAEDFVKVNKKKSDFDDAILKAKK